MSINANHSQLLIADLNFILEHTHDLWQEMQGQRLFMTGGTGFFGKWLLESFLWANQQLRLNAEVLVLTRQPHAFAQQYPHLASQPALHLQAGDVKNFSFPHGDFSHLIHAATAASAALNEQQPLTMLDTIVTGSRQTFEFAAHARVKKTLFISSGAVYGRQPPALSHLHEDFAGTLRFDDPRASYAIGKFTAEHLAALYAHQSGLEIKIARCFAFVGPYLPLDVHFAIGNFILQGLQGKTITLTGDGTPYRSYLYAADLMIWLWTILFRGQSLRPYNVGSAHAYSIAELANIVAQTFSPVTPIHIAKSADPLLLPERYVPDIKRCQSELGLKQHVDLVSAIAATKRWWTQQFSSEC